MARKPTKKHFNKVRANIAQLAASIKGEQTLAAVATETGIAAATFRRALNADGLPSGETLIRLLWAGEADPREVLACK